MIIKRQRPREGTSFATYAHQRPPKSFSRYLLVIGSVVIGSLGLAWLL